MVALGIPSLLSACGALYLPETNGKPLPQTLEEALTIDLSGATDSGKMMLVPTDGSPSGSDDEDEKEGMGRNLLRGV